MLLIVLTIGLVFFDIFDGLWLIWPLSFAFMLVTNGIWHLVQTIVLKEYSPGLATSPIYWVIMYFIIRFYYLPGKIETFTFFCLSCYRYNNYITNVYECLLSTFTIN